MTTAYTLDVRSLGKEVWGSAERLLPAERLEKAASLRDENARKLSLGAGLLLWYALRKAGIDPASVRYDETGKPILHENGAYISLSHSGGWAACALSDYPVGIDVQDMIEGDPQLLIKFFHPDERNAVRQGGSNSFYQIWCRKECYVKAFGWQDLSKVNTMVALNHGHYYDFQIKTDIAGCVLSKTQPSIWKVRQDDLLQEWQVCL